MERKGPALMDNQKKAVDKFKNSRSALIFHDVGTGKTETSLELMGIWSRRFGESVRVLVLTKKAVLEQWHRHMRRAYPDFRSMALTGDGVRRVKSLNEFIGPNRAYSGGLVVNYEALRSSAILEAIRAWNPQILIGDEGHVLKSDGSQVSGQVYDLARRAEHVALLTGTPVLKDFTDFFSQVKIATRGSAEYLGSNFFVWRKEYCVDRNESWKGRPSYFPKWEFRSEKKDRLMSIISGISDFATRQGLPPFLHEVRTHTLGKTQRELYERVKQEFVAWWDGRTQELLPDDQQSQRGKAVVAEAAMVRLIRLLQISLGYVVHDTGEVSEVANGRAELYRATMEELLQKPGRKVLTWAAFRPNYATIGKELQAIGGCDVSGVDWMYISETVGDGFGYVFLTGDTRDKGSAVRKFREHPKVQVLVGNQQAGGVGIDLFESDTSVYFSRNTRLEDDHQSEARNYRKGSEIHESVLRIDLVAADTVDEYLLEMLRGKKDMHEGVMRWVESEKARMNQPGNMIY